MRGPLCGPCSRTYTRRLARQDDLDVLEAEALDAIPAIGGGAAAFRRERTELLEGGGDGGNTKVEKLELVREVANML